jgi:hypothetical protein
MGEGLKISELGKSSCFPEWLVFAARSVRWVLRKRACKCSAVGSLVRGSAWCREEGLRTGQELGTVKCGIAEMKHEQGDRSGVGEGRRNLLSASIA